MILVFSIVYYLSEIICIISEQILSLTVKISIRFIAEYSVYICYTEYHSIHKPSVYDFSIYFNELNKCTVYICHSGEIVKKITRG